MRKQTKAEKQADTLIERIYGQSCSGVQIDIMDIPRVFRVGHEAIARGATHDELRAAIVGFVQTIRRN